SILLNLLCYLLTVIVFYRWSGTIVPSRGALIATAAFSFSPTLVLWSLQPMKDTFFFFLMIAAGAAFGRIVLLLRSRMASKQLLLLTSLAVAMLLSIYFISAVRWYVGFAYFGTLATLLLLSPAFSAKGRRMTAAVYGIVLSIL